MIKNSFMSLFRKKVPREPKSADQFPKRAKSCDKSASKSKEGIKKSESGFSWNSREIEIQIRYRNEISTKIIIERHKASEHSCGWLRREAERNLNRVDLDGRFKTEIARMVSLKTVPTCLPLDYWLTLCEKTLEIFPDKIVLEPIIAPEPIKSSKNSDPLSKVNLSDFEICGLLGSGHFAKVYLVRKKSDGNFYALKQLQKDVLDERQIKRLIKERDNLLKVWNYKSIKLFYAFQTTNFCYLVTQFCVGGDLLKLLYLNGPLSEDNAKYYVLEVLKGLKMLHSRNVLYRNLKPENLLLDVNYEIYFSDFGLCKKMKEPDALNYTICGNPELCAPEIFKNEGYSYSVDHYNIGTLTYELILQKTPFNSKKDQSDLRDDVLTKDVEIPEHLSPELKDFLKKLLNKDPKSRLGKNGVDEIMNHPWLRSRSGIPLKTSVFSLLKILTPCAQDIDKNVDIDEVSPKWYDESAMIRTMHVDRFSLYSKQATIRSDVISIRSVSNYDQDESILQENQFQLKLYKKLISMATNIPDEVGPNNRVNKADDGPLMKIKSPMSVKVTSRCEDFSSKLAEEEGEDWRELNTQEDHLNRVPLCGSQTKIFDKLKKTQAIA